MKKLIYISVLMIAGNMWGQQLPISNFAEYAHATFNPSLSGQTSKLNVSLIHRSWWSGVNNAPGNQWLIAEYNINERSGAGLTINRDVRGLSSRLGVNGAYSYGVRLTDDSRLLFGLAAKWEQYSMSFGNAIVVDANDPFTNLGTVKEGVFDASFGLTYIKDKLIVGASSINLLGMDSESTYTNLSQNFFFHASYGIELTNDIELLPHIFSRYMVNTPIAIMADVNARYKDFIEVGVGYNHGYAINANLGVYYKNFYMGYSYDIGINGISDMGLGHEVMIGFRKPIGVVEKPIEEDGFFMTEEEANKKIFELIDEYFTVAESTKSDHHKKFALHQIREEIHQYLPFISEEKRNQIEDQIKE